LEQFFARKTGKFYMDGIMKLPEIWLKVIEKDGAFIDIST
jgi:hypothetical protein